MVTSILKYIFVAPEPGNTELIKFTQSKYFIWWIILFEVLITWIIYKNVPEWRIKEYLPVVLFSCILFTLALHNGVLDLQGSPTGDHRMMYMAESQKVLAGHWPWEDPNYEGELTTYSYLYFTIIAIIYFFISMVSSISLGKLYILLNVVNKAIFLFVMYWAGKRLFNRWVGLLASFFALFYFGYWGGPHWPGVMLQVFTLVWFYEEKYLKSGLTLGLLVWVYYPHAIVVALSMIVYRLFVFLSIEDETVHKNFRILAKTFLIGGLVSAPFTLPLFLKYHFVVMNKVRMLDPLQEGRFNIFSGIPQSNILFYKIFILGLILAFVRRKKNDLLILSWFITTYLVAHHIIITHFNFYIRQMLRTRILDPVIVLLLSIAVFEVVKFLYRLHINITDKEIKRETFLKIGIVALIIMWGPSSIGANLGRPAIWDVWEKPDHQGVMRTMGWINNNTGPDDVLLVDYGYANTYVGPFTGRKVVFAGIHTNLFLDPNIRGSDYNYMYYGSNFTKIKDLLIKYDVKYVIDSRNTYHGTSKNKTLIPFDFSKHKEFKRQPPGDIWRTYEFTPTLD